MNITMIVLKSCPYCLMAKQAIKELREAYGFENIKIDEFYEGTEPEEVKGKYYYVPSMFVGDKKIYEASPRDTKQSMKSTFKEIFDNLIK